MIDVLVPVLYRWTYQSIKSWHDTFKYVYKIQTYNGNVYIFLQKITNKPEFRVKSKNTKQDSVEDDKPWSPLPFGLRYSDRSSLLAFSNFLLTAENWFGSQFKTGMCTKVRPCMFRIGGLPSPAGVYTVWKFLRVPFLQSCVMIIFVDFYFYIVRKSQTVLSCFSISNFRMFSIFNSPLKVLDFCQLVLLIAQKLKDLIKQQTTKA